MAQNKTQPTTRSVTAFLNAIEDPERRRDCKKVVALMRAATGEPAKMWGSSIVGFGQYHYKYASGREGDHMITGFSPRAQSLTLYIMPGFKDFEPLMKKLGRFKTGKSCLYIKRLADVDENVLRRLIEGSVAYMRDKYPTR